MATTKLYLDTRTTDKDGCGTLRLMINHHSSSTSSSLGIRLKPEEWDGKQIICRPDKKKLNAYILKKKADVDITLMHMEAAGEIIPKKASALREKIEVKLNPNHAKNSGCRFIDIYNKVTATKTEGSQLVYGFALNKMKAYDSKLDKRSFDDMGDEWFEGFIAFMSRNMCKNGMINYLASIRAVFNYARKEGLATYDPFRKIDMKAEKSEPYALSLEEVRTIATMRLEPWQEEYRDMFMLMFYLNGIRPVDLLCAKKEQLCDGRFVFTPKKTRNTSGIKLSVKLEPEVLALIEKHKGTNWLVSPLDRYADYKDYLKHMNRALRTFGLKYEEGKKPEGEALFPELSAYWARHSWATIALNDFGYSVDVVGQALGHKDNAHKITWIYIKPDYRRVDEASRTLIDAVIGKKQFRSEPSEDFGQFCYSYSY